jgi:hypothetical protein
VALYGTEATFLQNPLGVATFRSRDPAARPEAVDEPATTTAKGDLVPSFVRAILDGTPADVECGDVLYGMAVSLAIERSMREQRPIIVDYSPIPSARAN